MAGPETPKDYSLDRVSCNFAGVPIESGYGEGAAIKIEKAEPSFGTKKGADGTIVRFKIGGKLYKVTITLMQTAAGNQILSAINQADEASDNGVGIAPMLIEDRNGTSLHAFSHAWIEQAPAVEYNTEPTNREWIFAAVAAVANIGSS